MGFSRPEKHAWFNLAVLATATSLFMLLWGTIGRAPATGAIGVLGLWALGPIFYRGGQDRTFEGADELEQLIQRRSLIVGLLGAWTSMGAIGLVVWAVSGMAGRISVHVLPGMVGASLIVFVAVHAVGTLVQYSAVYRYGGG
jgi:hypothetical protein